MEDLLSFITNFSNKRLVVIGDLMLDHYLKGEVEKLNPEAPVPVVNLKEEWFSIGGAGNVASNIISLGAKVSLFAFIGKDKNSEILKNLLRGNQIEYFLDENETTTEKTRIIGRGQQIVRIDKEDNSEKIFNKNIKKTILEKASESDMIIISDYAKGVITKDLMDLLKDFKRKMIVNPKPKNTSLYKDVFLIIPNEKESKDMSLSNDYMQAGEKLKSTLNSNILITLGSRGMMLFSNKNILIPAISKEVYDVTGASDSAVAAISLALASGAGLEEAGIIGNQSAGISINRIGTYGVKIKELHNEISGKNQKIKEIDELKEIILDLRKKGKKIAWTNGCFDVFHAGHKYSLEKAKEKGDVLIVGLDSDESVKILKGEGRPIYNEKERAEILSALEFVDYIIIFPFNSAKEYLNILKPDVYVKSGDYTLETINQEERKLIEDYGGEIFLPKGLPNISTTKIIEKIKDILKNN